MTVYVDNFQVQATVGRITAQWSHLFSWPWDDPGELHALAARIGLSRRWYQDKEWPRGHYDVTSLKRRLAIAAGAVPVSCRDMGKLMSAARKRGLGNPPPASEADRWRPPALEAPAAVIQALTLRQPWAWAVVHAGKTTENRSWYLPAGPLWLHAGARSRWDPAGAAHPLVREAWRRLHGDVPLDRNTDLMPFKAVVALIEVGSAHHSGDCAHAPGQILYPGHEDLCDAWAISGQVHNPVSVTNALQAPVPCDGRQKLWPLPEAAEEAARAQIKAGAAP
jgi:hypothetical protein